MGIKEFISRLRKEDIVKRNLLDHTWISGSSTEVYPIQIWQTSIDLQWKSSRNPKVWIQKMVDMSKGLITYGIFEKGDGSCPNCISFKLATPRW